jgi:hypothetical protein
LRRAPGHPPREGGVEALDRERERRRVPRRRAAPLALCLERAAEPFSGEPRDANEVRVGIRVERETCRSDADLLRRQVLPFEAQRGRERAAVAGDLDRAGHPTREARGGEGGERGQVEAFDVDPRVARERARLSLRGEPQETAARLAERAGQLDAGRAQRAGGARVERQRTRWRVEDALRHERRIEAAERR